MKLLFFHVSHTDLIEEFLPREGVYKYNFYWVDDRYHNYTSLEHPEKHLHFFIRDPSSWQDIDLAAAAFGQGISATPLQVLMAFSAIANDGVMMEPHVVSQVK